MNGYDGHIGSSEGDGLLAMLGHPIGREDDARRAVQAGLEITREVSRLSDHCNADSVSALVSGLGCTGVVCLDAAQGDFSGLAANVATGISGLSPPGAVVVSDAVETLIRNDFELEACAPAAIKGVKEPIIHYRVMSERAPVA